MSSGSPMVVAGIPILPNNQMRRAGWYYAGRPPYDLGASPRKHRRPNVTMMEGTFNRTTKKALRPPTPIAPSSASPMAPT